MAASQEEIDAIAWKFVEAMSRGGDQWIEAGGQIERLKPKDQARVHARIETYTEAVARQTGRC
jgi:hypothetical protein